MENVVVSMTGCCSPVESSTINAMATESPTLICVGQWYMATFPSVTMSGNVSPSYPGALTITVSGPVETPSNQGGHWNAPGTSWNDAGELEWLLLCVSVALAVSWPMPSRTIGNSRRCPTPTVGA